MRNSTLVRNPSSLIFPSHLRNPSTSRPHPPSQSAVTKVASWLGEVVEDVIDELQGKPGFDSTTDTQSDEILFLKKPTKTVHFQSPETPRQVSNQQQFLSPANNAPASSSPLVQESGINKSVQDTRPAHVGDDGPSSSATGALPHQNQSVLETMKNIATAPSMEELKMQLAEARAQVASMGSEGGLRMRKAANAVGVEDVVPAAQAAMGTASSEGVPVQWTALLCLISFLIAYFFF